MIRKFEFYYANYYISTIFYITEITNRKKYSRIRSRNYVLWTLDTFQRPIIS